MTTNWTAGMAFAAVLAAALTGCDKAPAPSTPPPPKTGIATSEQSRDLVAACANVGGLERKLCKADLKIEAARARLKQRQVQRQTERILFSRGPEAE